MIVRALGGLYLFFWPVGFFAFLQDTGQTLHSIASGLDSMESVFLYAFVFVGCTIAPLLGVMSLHDVIRGVR